MPLYQVVLLAVVQGFTEFLPISSSAHLALAPWLLGWPDQGLSFDIALHFGTLLAVIVYFFRDWVQVVGQGLGLNIGSDVELKLNRSLLWLLVAATIPVGVAGLLFQHIVEDQLRTNHILIGSMLIIVGLIMGFGDRLGKSTKTIGQVSFLDAIVIGVAQAFAIIPGTSRSGATITAARFRDLDRPTAARFSFLLSTPAIAAAALKDFWDLHKHGGIPADERTAFLVGVAVSAITGGVVIAFFLNYLRRNTLRLFVAYRVVFGILIIALALFRR